MKWLSKVVFDSKAEPLPQGMLSCASSFLGEPLSEYEKIELNNVCGGTDDIDFMRWELPRYVLPNELVELLKVSNGGLFYNGEREIGVFGLEYIRDYYLRYLFPEFQPGAVPFGFNGGGIFYAYDLRNPSNFPPIIAISSGCLEWGESVVLGHSLEEVFSKSTDIADEM